MTLPLDTAIDLGPRFTPPPGFGHAAGTDMATPRHADRQIRLRPGFVERMLEEPLVRLVMAADGVSAAEIRRLYAGTAPIPGAGPAPGFRYRAAPCDPVPESGPNPRSPRPGIGE